MDSIYIDESSGVRRELTEYLLREDDQRKRRKDPPEEKLKWSIQNWKDE